MPRYGNDKIYIDDSEFQRKARKLARKYGVDEYDFVKEQTGLLARDVAKMTPPWASFPSLWKGTSIGTAKDIKQGKFAVLKDLKQICFVVPQDVADRVHQQSKGGPIWRRDGSGSNRVVSPGVITNMGALRSWHHENENARGRTKKVKVPNLPWVGDKLFNSYVKAEQANVGVAKAAFWLASVALGAKGAAPAAVKKIAYKSSGGGSMHKTIKGPYGLINGSAKGLHHAKRFLPQLRSNRLKKAVKRLEYIGRAAAKQAGFKVV